MDRIVERDPRHIAETLRRLRSAIGWTQENLAAEANLTTRTIEKLESGRHSPNEQTLRSIARAFNVPVALFDKTTQEEFDRLTAEIERTATKKLMVPIFPIRTANDFLARYDEWDAWRIDISAVEGEEAQETAAALADYLGDLDGIWSLCSMSERLGYARSFADLCQQISERGYRCYLGHHRQRLRETGKARLVTQVGVMTVQAKRDGDAQRFALVELEGAWETLEEDRPRFPA